MQSVNDAVDAATNHGRVTVVAAAGNNNGNTCQFSPASAPTAIAVGATDNADRKASFSNHGSCMSLFAPGASITSTWIGNPDADNTISGTSMASPLRVRRCHQVLGHPPRGRSRGRQGLDLAARFWFKKRKSKNQKMWQQPLDLQTLSLSLSSLLFKQIKEHNDIQYLDTKKKTCSIARMIKITNFTKNILCLYLNLLSKGDGRGDRGSERPCDRQPNARVPPRAPFHQPAGTSLRE